jgi:hypothetical protein
MKNFFILFLFSLLLNQTSWAVSHTEPDAPQPMPALLGSQWLIFHYVKYEDGLLTQRNDWTQTCEDKHYTPQVALEMKLGKDKAQNLEPVAISPYMNGYGSQIGIILYYRKISPAK